MPKKKIIVKYLCEICDCAYGSKKDAFACEARGIAIPEFKRHEVVELFGLPSNADILVCSGYRIAVKNGTKGVVYEDGCESDDSDGSNLHLLPAYYEVFLLTSSGSYRREIAVIPREKLRKVRTKDGTVCPLCGSATAEAKIVCDPVLSIGSGLPLLRGAPMHECPECGVEFFTTAQSKYVDSVVAKEVKLPLANTRRLIKDMAFRY